jgi:hypothetical protein
MQEHWLVLQGVLMTPLNAVEGVSVWVAGVGVQGWIFHPVFLSGSAHAKRHNDMMKDPAAQDDDQNKAVSRRKRDLSHR